MRPLTAGFAAIGGAVVLGAASRLVVTDPMARTTAVLFAALGVAACFAAAWDLRSDALRRRVSGVAGAAVMAFAAAWSSAAASGSPSALGGAAVVAGCAATACGIAGLLRARGVVPHLAAFSGASAVGVLAAIVFVADPFVEWKGGGDGSRARAEAVIAMSPLAAIGADTGLDWQRARWLYDGPAPGTPGLSVIGQYYPSKPSAPFAFGVAAAVAGLAAAAVSIPKRTAVRGPG